MKTNGESGGIGVTTQVAYTLLVEGAVQLVGFRPTVHRLAQKCHVYGSAENTSSGATITIEGDAKAVHSFRALFPTWLQKRRLAVVTNSLVWQPYEPTGTQRFVIRKSDQEGPKTAALIPDASICPACSKAMRDQDNRMYKHPFASCIDCGPRVSIQTGIPGDREHTTMVDFPLCPACQKDYNNINSRFYHAQAFCCANCGPTLALWDHDHVVLGEKAQALELAIQALKAGKIVAVKGNSGIHLCVLATHAEAVSLLRERKKRTKPLAIMDTLQRIKRYAKVSARERALLASPAAPIVILQKRKGVHENAPVEDVAGVDNPTIGVMIPYSPLYQLLVEGVGSPLVVTSANFTDDPVMIDEKVARERLRDIVDMFLVHNRRIVQHMDDSVVRIVEGKVLYLRRGRGYAPFPFTIPAVEEPLLAVGPHQKNTVTLAIPASPEVGKAIVSQHIGDLTSMASEETFQQVIATLCALYQTEPKTVLCDLHPRYHSTEWAQATGKAVFPVQHHVAHVLAVAGEHQIPGPFLGFAFDGTGLGPDGTIWGGEALAFSDGSIVRVAHLEHFCLPGGDKVAREPYRSALGVLYAMVGEDFGTTYRDLAPITAADSALDMLMYMLRNNENTPRTSSAGRLFDAVAALLGIRERCGFEGQAAMELEWCATKARKHWPITDDARIEIIQGTDAPYVLAWKPLLHMLINGVRKGEALSRLAYVFHAALADAIVRIAQQTGHDRVVLSGGCFQNKLLLELTIRLLTKHNIQPYWPNVLPPNDGAISFGQIQTYLYQRRYSCV